MDNNYLLIYSIFFKLSAKLSEYVNSIYFCKLSRLTYVCLFHHFYNLTPGILINSIGFIYFSFKDIFKSWSKYVIDSYYLGSVFRYFCNNYTTY